MQSEQAALDEMAADCRDMDGIEVPRDAWHLAERLVKTGKYTLGPARGPDRAWKRLEEVDG